MSQLDFRLGTYWITYVTEQDNSYYEEALRTANLKLIHRHYLVIRPDSSVSDLDSIPMPYGGPGRKKCGPSASIKTVGSISVTT